MNNIGKKDRVSCYQVVLLITVYEVMTRLTYLSVASIPPANQDMWIVSLTSIPYIILFCSPLLYLGNRFNNLTLLGYANRIMGRILGKIIGIFYTIFLFIGLMLLLGVLVEILNSSLFPETPTCVTASIMLITCIYISYGGFKNMARLGEITIPFVIIMIFLFIALGYKNYDFKELLPVLKDSTYKQINAGAINIGIRFSEITILAMMTPYLEVREDLNRIFFRSLMYSMGISILIVVAVQLSLGIEFVKHINFPFLTFTRLLALGRDIQGFDSLYIISWIMGNVIKISGYLYFTTLALEEIIGRRNQDFIIPVSVIALILIILIKDRRPILAATRSMQRFMFILSVIAILIIPLIMLVAYFFRRNSLKQGKG